MDFWIGFIAGAAVSTVIGCVQFYRLGVEAGAAARKRLLEGASRE